MATKTTPEPGKGFIQALRYFLKQCAGKATRVRPISGNDFKTLARVVRLPLPRDSEARLDAVQDALAEIHRKSREGRTEDVLELLELDDRALVGAFGLRVRRRLIDAAPNRGALQALRHHVRAALVHPEKLPRAASFPSAIRTGDAFVGRFVAQATSAALKEIGSEAPELLKKGWELDELVRRKVTRMVMSRLREEYLPRVDSGRDVDMEPGQARKRSAMAPRTALRLVSEMAHRVGPTKTAVFILQAAGRSLPEIAKHLGIAPSTAHRGGLVAGKVLRSAVMREKGRLRLQGIDVADAARVVPSDSEWAEVLGEIGKVVNARGPLRDGQREDLRRLVEDILSSA